MIHYKIVYFSIFTCKFLIFKSYEIQCVVRDICFFFLQEKLEKAADKLKANKIFFIPFVNRMDRWLVVNARLAIDLFKKYDQADEGIINYDEFKSGECIKTFILGIY